MNAEALRAYLGEKDRIVVDVQLTMLAARGEVEHAAGLYRAPTAHAREAGPFAPGRP